MSYFTLGYRLPRPLRSRLFGDRERYGLRVQPEDPCWKEWMTRCLAFYQNVQKKSVGARVNDAGYRVLNRVNLSGLRVLELGPGVISHDRWWRGKLPAHYAIADTRPEMLELSAAKLKARGIPHSVHLLPGRGEALPFGSGEFDLVLSFYCFEHLNSLDAGLDEVVRVLKPGATLCGAIPCEGGISWGLGRYLTSRRWLLRNTSINPDKIICWEHPNFADGILRGLDARMARKHSRFWPLSVPSIDLNLIATFIYEKSCTA